ncbi:MAG: OmpH family outer membrane protein [Thermodesulfovibrionales bacterium]
MMKKVLAAITVSVLLLVGTAYAEENIKIGYVDMRRALNECKAGKIAKVELETMIKAKQKFLDDERKKLDEMQSELEKKASLLSEKAKEEKQKEFQEKVQAYQKLLADAQKEINEKEAEYTKRIIDDIREIVSDIAKSDGYTLVFEKTEISVMYAKDGLDLTDKVVEKYNSKTK